MNWAVPKPLLALLFGLSVPLALAPFNVWPLMFIGVAGFFWLQQNVNSQKQALWLGWLYGIGYFGLGVSWVYGSMRTVETPIPLSLLLTSGFCLAMALFHALQMWTVFKLRNVVQLPLWLFSASSWVAFEWFREWFLTGMPWLYAGYSWLSIPAGQLAAIVGVYGLSLFLAIMSALIAHHAKNPKAWTAAITLFASLNLIGALWPATHWTQPGRTLTVAAIQSNVPQKTKWSGPQQQKTLNFYQAQVEKHEDVDLMLWSEAAMTRRAELIPSFMAYVQSTAIARDQAIVTGVVNKDGERFFNALQGYGTAFGEEYHKQHLVPFGEYVPFDPHLRSLLAFFDISISGMSPALSAQVPMQASLNGEPYFMAPIICYEAAYPGIVKALAEQSDLIIVASNDAWFGNSIAPHQHLQITQMRAIENGRAILRATQNGISAIIAADGSIVQQSAQFVVAELKGELILRSGRTPFQFLASTTLPVLSIVVVFMGLLLKRLAKKG